MPEYSQDSLITCYYFEKKRDSNLVPLSHVTLSHCVPLSVAVALRYGTRALSR